LSWFSLWCLEFWSWDTGHNIEELDVLHITSAIASGNCVRYVRSFALASTLISNQPRPSLAIDLGPRIIPQTLQAKVVVFCYTGQRSIRVNLLFSSQTGRIRLVYMKDIVLIRKLMRVRPPCVDVQFISKYCKQVRTRRMPQLECAQSKETLK
jgi:hypothetical protein